MKAAVLYETGKPLIVEDGIEIPSEDLNIKELYSSAVKP